MRITTKGRYALRAVLALAETSENGQPVSIKSLAEREDLSAEFLEQIFFKLRRAGVIGSVRGPGGGFYFSKPLSDITLLDIIEASGEGLEIAPCSCGKNATCKKSKGCAAGKVWKELDGHVRTYIESTTLDEMLHPAKN